MCGILGVRTTWLNDRRAVESALDTLAWRGPDGSALTRAGPDWWLGVARLAITDLTASQPLECPRTGRIVAFNGAVTSAQSEWPAFDGLARTRNDAELLLLRAERDGPEGLLGMTGPYAVAVVDPAERCVWLGRDPEGEKPLWLGIEAGQVVAFASSRAALRALGFDVGLTAEQRRQFVQFGMWVPDRDTAVVELPPGLHRLADAEAEPDRGARVPRSRDGDLGRGLERAVARCTTAEVPVALTLSGGIDSACIAVAAAGAGRRLDAFQFCAVGEPQLERERAQAVASQLGHHLRLVDGRPNLLTELERLTTLQGGPVGDPSTLAALAVAQAAAGAGAKVILSGEGADDLLLGYRRQRLAAWLPARSPRATVALAGSRGTLARAWRAWRGGYEELLRVPRPRFAADVFAPELAEPSAFAVTPAPPGRMVERARILDREVYLRRDLLPKLDLATMAAGIEGRAPFLDPAVLDSAAVREPRTRLVLGKAALRAAFGSRLPPGFMRQRKRGFAVPLDRWFAEDDFLADVLSDQRTVARAHLRADGLRAAIDRGRRDPRAGDGHALYLVAALELFDRWLEDAPSAGGRP